MPDEASPFVRCNATELYQLCVGAGIPVHPNYSKEKMIALLEGTEEPVDVNHPTYIWRDAIMEFVEEYWAKLRSQLTCPAKTRDPKACYGCVDTQVYACLVENEQMEPYIQLKRKPR